MAANPRIEKQKAKPLNTKNSRNRKKPFREHQNQYVTAYQMTTLSSSGRNMAPSVIPTAS